MVPVSFETYLFMKMLLITFGQLVGSFCGHNLLLCRVLAQLLLRALQANFCPHFDSLKSYMLYIVIWSRRIYCCNTLLCLKSKSLILGLVVSTMKEVSSSIWNNPRLWNGNFTKIGLKEQIKWTLNNKIWVKFPIDYWNDIGDVK